MLTLNNATDPQIYKSKGEIANSSSTNRLLTEVLGVVRDIQSELNKAECMSEEWRQVALVLDRLFMVLILVATQVTALACFLHQQTLREYQ